MAGHVWGPSRLNHGSKQCVNCLCTYEEAKYALGDECSSTKKPKLKLVDKEQIDA